MQPPDVYKVLMQAYGNQDWWPITHGLSPPGWEICVGSILTQNTTWANVEKSLSTLSKNNCKTLQDMLNIETQSLAKLIRPSGYFNQKAVRLKALAEFISSFGSFKSFQQNVTRDQLLSLKGIGPETADCILLYACNRPEFVIDAYTKRLFSRLGLLSERSTYNQAKHFFESSLPKDPKLFNQYHALIVEHSKQVCRKRPLCDLCSLKTDCVFVK